MYIPLLNDDAASFLSPRSVVHFIFKSRNLSRIKKKRKKGNKYTVDEYNNKWPGVITGVILCRTFLRRDKCFSMDYVL